MRKTLPAASILFLSLCSFLFSLAGSASAQVSLVVSPPRYDAVVKPGESIQKTVKVTNNSDSAAISLQAFVTDFIVQDDSGTPIKVSEKESGRYLASPWFTLDQSELTLAPKQTQELIVLISVPQDALPGGHYAGIFFQPSSGNTGSGTRTELLAQVGSLFGLTISGDLSYHALIKDFRTESRLSEYGPINFSTIIENQSDTHIRPLASITIRDLFGRQLETIALDEVNIFPFTTRTLEGSWDTTWGLGRYTATLDVSYGPGLVASRTLFFWILPYRLLAAALVLLLVILSVTISLRRHLAHRSDTRDQEIGELKRRIAELENQ